MAWASDRDACGDPDPPSRPRQQGGQQLMVVEQPSFCSMQTRKTAVGEVRPSQTFENWPVRDAREPLVTAISGQGGRYSATGTPRLKRDRAATAPRSRVSHRVRVRSRSACCAGGAAAPPADGARLSGPHSTRRILGITDPGQFCPWCKSRPGAGRRIATTRRASPCRDAGRRSPFTVDDHDAGERSSRSSK